MLPKANRLSRTEIEKIKKSRLNPISGKYFGLVSLPNDQSAKFAVVVTKKTVKGAVERNRLRRLVYASVYPKKDCHGWYLYLAKRGVLNANSRQIVDDVTGLLNQSLDSREN